MRHSSAGNELPYLLLAGTQAAIEGLTLVAGDEGAIAYATDENEEGCYDGASWIWKHTFTKVIRTTTAIYRRYYHVPLGTANPGASGPTWVEADGNTTGGWRLTNSAWFLRGQADVHDDWDGEDLFVEVHFALGLAGGAPADVVTLHLNCYYKGDGEAATKTQEIIVPVTVDAAAQYTQFDASFTIAHDEAGNVVDAGDIIAFVMNLDTGTSDVDNIIVVAMEFYYATTHLGIESGDT